MTDFLVRREGTLGVRDHEEIAATLALAFTGYAEGYRGSASWAGLQPEVRITAHDSRGVTAHAGVKRVFVQIGDGPFAEDHLVAAVGMVAVRPDLQGSGLGGRLADAVRGVLGALQVPFGLLETGEDTTGFYVRHGWRALPGAVGTYNDLSLHGPARVIRQDHGWHVLPVTADLEDWPDGEIHWNGQMV